MFIFVTYRDTPDLTRRRYSSEEDLAVEQTLLVNPDCPVRIMLEYIRNKCKLGKFTSFDLCDEDGKLKGLFKLPTFAYAKELFEHKKIYYIIVFDVGTYDTRQSILPQLNHYNKFYDILKDRVTNYILCTGTPSSTKTTSKSNGSSQASKTTKTTTSKKSGKK